MADDEQFDKAGIIIAGTNARGERCFVMPYTEGRFGYNYKFPSLPIGSVDPGESVRHTAARETREETGIDINLLLGNAAFGAFLAGKPIKFPIQSEGYPGVTIKSITRKPASHTYLSRAGVSKKCALFTIEADGIDALESKLKNYSADTARDFRVKGSVLDVVRDETKYPQFDDFMQWLDRGEMPVCAWNSGKEKPAGLYPDGNNIFQQLLHKKGEVSILNYRDWQKFCTSLKPVEFDELSLPIAKIKAALQEMQVIGSDNSVLKLDDKDTPLNFFQEGARLYPVTTYMKECQQCLHNSADYRLAFGATERAQMQGMKSVRSSQVASIGCVLPKKQREEFFNSLMPDSYQKKLISGAGMGLFGGLTSMAACPKLPL